MNSTSIYSINIYQDYLHISSDLLLQYGCKSNIFLAIFSFGDIAFSAKDGLLIAIVLFVCGNQSLFVCRWCYDLLYLNVIFSSI